MGRGNADARQSSEYRTGKGDPKEKKCLPQVAGAGGGINATVEGRAVSTTVVVHVLDGLLARDCAKQESGGDRLGERAYQRRPLVLLNEVH